MARETEREGKRKRERERERERGRAEIAIGTHPATHQPIYAQVLSRTGQAKRFTSPPTDNPRGNPPPDASNDPATNYQVSASA